MQEYHLPAEIISEVISHLDAPRRSALIPYATVSRSWQACIERHTFTRLNLNNPQQLVNLHQIVSTKRRQLYVREISFRIQLAPNDAKGETRAHIESAAEQGRNNDLFTTAIPSLLQILGTWPPGHPGIKLSIRAQPPVEYVQGSHSHPTMIKAAYGVPETGLLSGRHKIYYLEITEEGLEGLPSVPVVTELAIYGTAGSQRLIKASSCAVIASKMPHLRNVVLDLKDNEKRDRELRRDHRDDFANSLLLLPPSVQTLDLMYYNQCPKNENYSAADLIHGRPEDPFSARFRDFSQRLTSLFLDHAVVGRELFWPLTHDNNTQLPYWPNLTTFCLSYQPTTPSGHWYFELSPGQHFQAEYSQPDETSLHDYSRPPPEDRLPRYFRTRASPELMGQFYLSAGRAAQRMPRLQRMELRCFLRMSKHRFVYQVDGEGATATWADSAGYAPEEAILQVWRDAAFQHTGVGSSLEVHIETPIFWPSRRCVVDHI